MVNATIGEALDLLVERAPSAPAVDDGVVALTRQDLQSRSRRLARLLIDRGVQEGDLVVVRGGNTADTVVAVCAVWRAGGTPLPLGPRVPEEEQRAIVALGRPSVALGAAPGAVGDLPTLPLAPDTSAFDDGLLPPLAAPSWKAVPTSGSTGTPKLVLAAAPARTDRDRQAASFLPLSARQLVVGPLTHSAPFTYAMRGLMTGHALVLLPRFDAEEVLAAIERHRITWVLLVPTMLHRILRLPPERIGAADLSSLEQVVHIGSAIDPELKRRWLALLGPERMTEVYAGSESNGLTVIRGDEWLQHPGSVGRPAGGTEVRVVDPDGYLFLADRGSDRITRAGTSCYPAELERILERHPLVRSAVVVGVVDDDLGQRIHAVADIALEEVTPEALRTWANERLDPERRIDTLEVTRTPVRDDAGKTRRRAHLPR